ncbi:MAG: phosphoribosyltransferase [Thermoplasmata archaeon]|nr:phosphoribosyltransferase [Euryarchaeota archaeon]RLF66786.1 MAG: phosphoribosyltransferase [Thermoplasmata archaeon]
MPSKIYLSWAEFEEAIQYIALKLRETEFHPDLIVAIARGGLIPGVRLSHILRVPMRSIHMTFYDEHDNRLERPILLIPLQTPHEVKGKKVLLVDDIADTGLTLKNALEYLKSLGVKEVKIATIAYKPSSIVIPDFYLFTTNKWVVFPWEKEPIIFEKGIVDHPREL